MQKTKIQQVFDYGWQPYCDSFNPHAVQQKAARSISNCKSGKLGCNISICQDCGFSDFHNNSCRNRNCPSCQAVLKELWIDQRKSEVIDSPYFHVVFTVPAELNPLFFANQKLLYSLLFRSCAQTLLELAHNPKYLGATPGIVQVLHTWGQELNYHPHIHCIVSGGGLSADHKLKSCQNHFFVPAKVLATKFRGKFLALLKDYYRQELLTFPPSCQAMRHSDSFFTLLDSLYRKQWCPDIRETFNGFGNAIEYLGRYTHRIAITNTRIKTVTPDAVTFMARDYKNNSILKAVTLTNKEFVRRMMMHVLPAGFQKIRYCGFLNNRCKQKNLTLIFRLQGQQRFKAMFTDLTMAEILKRVWDYNTGICPECGCCNMRHAGRTYSLRN